MCSSCFGISCCVNDAFFIHLYYLRYLNVESHLRVGDINRCNEEGGGDLRTTWVPCVNLVSM